MGKSIQYPPCIFGILTKGIAKESENLDKFLIILARCMKSQKSDKDEILTKMMDWKHQHKIEIEGDKLPLLIKKSPRNFQLTCKDLRMIPELNDGCDESECFRASDRALEDIVYMMDPVKILVGDPTHYVFTFGDKIFNVKDSELMTPMKFKVWYLNNFRRLVPIGTKDWQAFVNDALENAEISKPEELSEDTEVLEAMLHHLSNCTRVANIEDCLGDWNRAYPENGNILIPSTSIKYFIERLPQKITARKLTVIMANHLADTTTLKRIADKPFRFWVFKDDVIPDKTVFDLTEGDEEEQAEKVTLTDYEEDVKEDTPIEDEEQSEETSDGTDQ